MTKVKPDGIEAVLENQALIVSQLDVITEALKRIEQRQIKTTAMVSEVKEHEGPIVGSFGTTDEGK